LDRIVSQELGYACFNCHEGLEVVQKA
jgi:hypothetical protein